MYLQSLKDCLQISHNFTEANPTLISYFYNPLVLLSVDDFDVLSFDLGIDEQRFKVELDFKVVCDVVPKVVQSCCDVVFTYGYVPINNVESNLMLNVNSSMWINKQQNIKFSKDYIQLLNDFKITLQSNPMFNEDSLVRETKTQNTTCHKIITHSFLHV